MAPPLLRSAAAELIGTFALVFAGCGRSWSTPVGHISGAHFNPSVTFAFALTPHFPWRNAVVYWIAQLAGALGAALILRGSLGNRADVGATLPAGSQGQAFLGKPCSRSS